MRIVLIEDERLKRVTLVDALQRTGHDVEGFESPLLALSHLERADADVVVSDIRLPGMNGLEVLRRVKETKPDIAVIIMTAFGTIESAVDAMKSGAFDYIVKPFPSDRLVLILKKLEEIQRLREENLALKNKLEERFSFHNLVGRSKVMRELYSQIETIAKTECTLMIEGESGTGKELVANAIHYNSLRRENPFVKLSCAVLNESLLESELFGHERGAFTGAVREKKGRFELAHQGTLFLDDVDDIPLGSQVKLLRVLQEREFERVGGNTPIPVDVRLICATKVDLWEKVQSGTFREDLYYRIKVIPIKLAPLRERREDIPALIDHFLARSQKPDLRFSVEALEMMIQAGWPGNVRQLENIVQRIAALAMGDIVQKEMIPADIHLGAKKQDRWDFDSAAKSGLGSMMAEFEHSALRWALEQSGNNQAEAARLLRLSRTTLRDKLRKHSLI